MGIIEGTGDTFSPDGMVSRARMAVFPDKFVEVAPIGPGGPDGDVSDHDGPGSLDDRFTDVAGVSFNGCGAIRRAYELGIAKGTGDGATFSPNVLVTRGQMAAFITRALAHTNARPAGVSIRSDKAETGNSTDGEFVLQISVRDDGHAPVVDAVADHCSASSARAAFDDDGLCRDLGDIVDPAEGSVRCEIDAGDEATDSGGNLEFEVSDTDSYCPGNTKWIRARTGDIGDEFDSDDTAAAMVGVAVTKAKAAIKYSHDAAASTVEFGDRRDPHAPVGGRGGRRGRPGLRSGCGVRSLGGCIRWSGREPDPNAQNRRLGQGGVDLPASMIPTRTPTTRTCGWW